MAFSQGTVMNTNSLSNDIQRQSINTAWDSIRDHATTAVTLEKISQGSISDSKMIEFALGDYLAETATLGAAFNSGGSSITLTEQRYFTGDMLWFQESSTTYALVRLTNDGNGSGVYSCTVLDGDGELSSGTVGQMAAPGVDLHGEARDFLNVTGDLGKQYFQRMRETIGKSYFETAEHFLVDNSLDGLVRKAFRSFYRKLNHSLFTNTVASGRRATGTDFQIFGGFPYFFNSKNATFSEANGIRTLAANGYYGKNKVDTGTTLDFMNILNWVEELVEYGNKDKFVTLSPAMYIKFLQAVKSEITVMNSSFAQFVPSFANAWEVPVADFGFGRLHLFVDRGLTGMKQIVTDGSNTANSLDWMVAYDPEYTRMETLNITGNQYTSADETGVQEVRIRPVTNTNNPTLKKIEFDGTKALVINDPRTGGYYGITGS